MPFKCPACSTHIRSQLIEAGHEYPVPNRIYRCVICRLELILNADGTEMVVAPVTPPGDTPRPRQRN